MFLSDFSIKKPLPTIVLIIAMMCLGVLAISKLRDNQNPDVEVPVLQLTSPYPDSSPETVEREIVNRLEKTLQSIPGVQEVNASASEGSANLWMEFAFDKNLIEASDDVR